MVLSAERANDIVLLPTGVADGTLAAFLIAEVVSKFKDAIEASEVNHKAQVQGVSILLYLKLGLIFHKIQTFWLEINYLSYFSG